MSKNNKPMPSSWRNDKIPIQFTELTTDDVHKHQEVYAILLIEEDMPVSKKGEELQNAMQLFYEEFK